MKTLTVRIRIDERIGPYTPAALASVLKRVAERLTGGENLAKRTDGYGKDVVDTRGNVIGSLDLE